MTTRSDSTPVREREFAAAISASPAFSPPPTVSLRRGSLPSAGEREPPP
jgi:hypothetical protein